MNWCPAVTTLNTCPEGHPCICYRFRVILVFLESGLFGQLNTYLCLDPYFPKHKDNTSRSLSDWWALADLKPHGSPGLAGPLGSCQVLGCNSTAGLGWRESTTNRALRPSAAMSEHYRRILEIIVAQGEDEGIREVSRPWLRANSFHWLRELRKGPSMILPTKKGFFGLH